MTGDIGENDDLHNYGELSEPYVERPNYNGIINNSYDFGVDLSNGLEKVEGADLNKEQKALMDYYGDDDEKTILFYGIIFFTSADEFPGAAFPANTPTIGGRLDTPNQIIIRGAFLGYHPDNEMRISHRVFIKFRF